MAMRMARTRPASLISKYFAPQRWMLYRLRACWMLQAPLASVELLISNTSNRSDYRTLPVDFNTENEKLFYALGGMELGRPFSTRCTRSYLAFKARSMISAAKPDRLLCSTSKA